MRAIPPGKKATNGKNRPDPEGQANCHIAHSHAFPIRVASRECCVAFSTWRATSSSLRVGCVITAHAFTAMDAENAKVARPPGTRFRGHGGVDLTRLTN